jgi:hypothetical protein
VQLIDEIVVDQLLRELAAAVDDDVAIELLPQLPDLLAGVTTEHRPRPS